MIAMMSVGWQELELEAGEESRGRNWDPSKRLSGFSPERVERLGLESRLIEGFYRCGFLRVNI